jgi:hypothetical protein
MRGWDSEEAPKAKGILAKAGKGVDESWKKVFGMARLGEELKERRF